MRKNRKLKKGYPMEEATLSGAEKEKEEREMIEMWEQISRKLNIHCPLPGDEWQSFTETDYRRAYEVEMKTRQRKHTFYRYAAMATIAVWITGVTYLLSNRPDAGMSPAEHPAIIYSTVDALPKKERLADGTQVELNRESSLTVSRTFGKEKREVTMEGQIFFDVAKDAGKPFVVNASEISVTVRGTSFGIVSYGEIPEKEVTVCTGRVEVRNARSGELLTTLTKGVQMLFNPETNTAVIRKVDAEMATAWREGKLILHHASLPELKLRIRQHFGKTLVIEDGALEEGIRVTSSFNTEEATVEAVMSRLCAMLKVRSRMEGDRIIIMSTTPPSCRP